MLLVVCLFIVLVCNSPVFAAKWYKDYEKAKKATKRGDWNTTIELLQKVIEKEPEPKERKRTYGIHFIKYYPYLELGKTYLEIGDKDKAREYCKEAEEKKVAPTEEIEKCLNLATPASATISMSTKEKQEKLKELLKQELIQPELFNCAFQMLESDKSDPLLDGLLSGNISPEVFNRAFSCDSE